MIDEPEIAWPWRRTWPDRPDSRDTDFVASHGAAEARIYRHDWGPASGQWFWTVAERFQIASGLAPSARAAAHAAEAAFAAWDAERRRTGRRPIPRGAWGGG